MHNIVMCPYRTYVENFHFLFLERLLRSVNPNSLILKGGVNLRFFFQSPRYSEDMDLDVSNIPVHVLREKGYSILNDKTFQRVLQTLEISEIRINDPYKAKQTQTTQRFRLRIVTRTGDEFPTKIEFSRRGLKGDTSTDLINPELARKYGRISFLIQHYSGPSAANQKIGALIHRSHPQVRDIFDLYILLMGGHITNHEIQTTFNKDELNKACETLLSFSFQDYKDQILNYLEDSYLEEYGQKSKWESIQELTLNFLSRCQ